MAKKWYVCTVNEAWIMEQLTPTSTGNFLTETAVFELRKYLKDGSVEVEQMDFADAVTTINLNRMTEFEQTK